MLDGDPRGFHGLFIFMIGCINDNHDINQEKKDMDLHHQLNTTHKLGLFDVSLSRLSV